MFSFLGIKIKKFKTFNKSKIKFICIIWNCFLYSVFFSRSLFPDAFIISLSEHSAFDKPLLQKVNSYNIIVNYPLSSFLIFLYFTFTGSAIVRCLDLPTFQTVYHQNHHFHSGTFNTFTITFLFYNVIFILSYYSLFAGYFKDPSQINVLTLLNVLYFYLVFSYFLLPVATMHYLLFGIYTKMQAIVCQLDCLPATVVVHQVKNLVGITEQLYSLLSVPLTIFLVAISLDMVICICLLYLSFDASIFFYVGVNYFYLVYLAYLNAKIQGSLRTISSNYAVKRKVFSQQQQKRKIDNNDKIRFCEITVYADYLSVHIFHLCSVDFIFTLKLIFFFVNYAVLILQTSKF